MHDLLVGVLVYVVTVTSGLLAYRAVMRWRSR